MKNKINLMFVIPALFISQLAFAEWSASHVPFVNKWVVSDGTTSIQFKKEKSAKKAAKALNKASASSKPKKEGSGFWDDGSEYCRNPLNEC